MDPLLMHMTFLKLLPMIQQMYAHYKKFIVGLKFNKFQMSMHSSCKKTSFANSTLEILTMISYPTNA